MESTANPSRIQRRTFFKAAGLATALQAGNSSAQNTQKPFIVDCQSHLFFPEVLNMMRKRAADPLVFMLCRWSRGFDRPARALPHVAPFLERMWARPAVQQVFEAEQLTPPAY